MFKKLYKNGRGVKEMSFTLNRGDIFGLLGSNGSGKTTAIRSICGLSPYKGEIYLFGESVADNPREALRRVGCIVETPAFYGNLTATQNLLLAQKYYGVPKREAGEAAGQMLDIVGLGRFKRERAERFSLGMKARLGLALCFISKPEFIALDEPLNGLDIEGMVEVRNIILKQASESGATFLISSHLAAEIEKTCNVVGVMDEGYLLDTAYMPDVLRNYGSVEAYYLSVLHNARNARGGAAGVVAPDSSGGSGNGVGVGVGVGVGGEGGVRDGTGVANSVGGVSGINRSAGDSGSDGAGISGEFNGGVSDDANGNAGNAGSDGSGGGGII
jgi:ABC-2 type transport system ATP-binding protein